MFDDEVPSLRILTLRGVPSPFKVMPPSLVHFDIGTLQGPLPPFNELLKTLGNCPPPRDPEPPWCLGMGRVRQLYSGAQQSSVAEAQRDVPRTRPSGGPRRAPLVPRPSPLPPHTNVVISSVLGDVNDFPRIGEVIVPPLAPSSFNGFRRLQVFRGGKD